MLTKLRAESVPLCVSLSTISAVGQVFMISARTCVRSASDDAFTSISVNGNAAMAFALTYM